MAGNIGDRRLNGMGAREVVRQHSLVGGGVTAIGEGNDISRPGIFGQGGKTVDFSRGKTAPEAIDAKPVLRGKSAQRAKEESDHRCLLLRAPEKLRRICDDHSGLGLRDWVKTETVTSRNMSFRWPAALY
ncbi:MAG: hypothetical protein M1358_17870 [Chloroflexi bacterium]|nr:hypothetical protein [Chloroflexota bacterium]